MKQRFFFIPKLLAGIVTGVLIHILVVLGLPNWLGIQVFERVQQSQPANQFVIVKTLQTGSENPHGLDPAFIQAVCHGSVAQAPILINANLPQSIWSINVYHPSGTLALTTTHRTDNPTTVRLALLNPSQARLFGRQSISLNQNVTIAELDGDHFFAVIRLWPPFEANRSRYEAFLSSASCQFLSL